jgi:hypothetical protein
MPKLAEGYFTPGRQDRCRFSNSSPETADAVDGSSFDKKRAGQNDDHRLLANRRVDRLCHHSGPARPRRQGRSNLASAAHAGDAREAAGLTTRVLHATSRRP